MEAPRALAEAALKKAAGRVEGLEALVASLAAEIAHVQTALRTALPQLVDELALRERPLREQWDARGPGMLVRIGNLTEEALVVPEAEVVLVHPAFGGGGDAHLSYNSVRMEAMLANAHAELPETVRLAWLVAQLQLDLPAIGENVHVDRLPHVARLAMLPAALQAAEDVELARFSPDLVRQALLMWRVLTPPGVDIVQILLAWWETYQQTRPPFSIALESLDQMMG
jgi:hypothetical protein